MYAAVQAAGSGFPDNILTLDTCASARYMSFRVGECNGSLVAY